MAENLDGLEEKLHWGGVEDEEDERIFGCKSCFVWLARKGCIGVELKMKKMERFLGAKAVLFGWQENCQSCLEIICQGGDYYLPTCSTLDCFIPKNMESCFLVPLIFSFGLIYRKEKLK
ncbi:hypothetical protein LguiB_000996 [Lonicera macranthoides]